MQVGSALTERGWEITIAGREDSEILKRAQSVNLSTIAWPFKRDFDWSTIRTASQWMRTNKPDAILVTTARDLRTVGLAAKRHRVPVVWRMGPKPKNNLIHRLTGALITKVIAPSETVKQELSPFTWLRGKIIVIPNGIAITPQPTEEQVVAARTILGLTRDSFLCLYVGRLMIGKGIDTLLDAFAKVHAKIPPAILWIVGAGPDEAKVKAQCTALGLDDAVSFRGYDADPSYYFAACDLFVLPSRYESFSYVLLEAMLNGKPCIATRAGAIPEVVGEEAAMLIPPGNPGALTDALLKLVDDPERRKELGENGRERVTSKFDLGRTVESVDNLFRQIISTESRS